MPNAPDSFIHSCKQAASPSNNEAHSLKLAQHWQRDTGREQEQGETYQNSNAATPGMRTMPDKVHSGSSTEKQFLRGGKTVTRHLMDKTGELIRAYIRYTRDLVLCPGAMCSMPPMCGNETNLSTQSKTPALLSAPAVWEPPTKYHLVVSKYIW